MSGKFWEGFEKRANFVQKGKDLFSGLAQHGKKMVGDMSQHLPPNMGEQATSYGKHLWSEAQKGLHESISEHAKKVGGDAGKAILGHLEGISKHMNPEAVTDALRGLARKAGISKKPQGLLGRAGEAVKKHPVAATGLGVAGLGGAGYAMSRPSKPQQPMGGQDYQYYNPYM